MPPQTFDVNDPASSPTGTSFRPSRPPSHMEPTGVNPFPDSTELDFERQVRAGTNRSILTARRRSDMRDFLYNPSVLVEHPDRKERQRLRSLKSWTLKHFEL